MHGHYSDDVTSYQLNINIMLINSQVYILFMHKQVYAYHITVSKALLHQSYYSINCMGRAYALLALIYTLYMPNPFMCHILVTHLYHGYTILRSCLVSQACRGHMTLLALRASSASCSTSQLCQLKAIYTITACCTDGFCKTNTVTLHDGRKRSES